MAAKSEIKYPEYLNDDFIQTALENYLCCSELKINEFEISCLASGAGENYCSDIYQVLVKYQQLGCEEERKVNMVVKSMPKHKQIVLRNLKIYNRECYFYKHILSKMQTLMRTKVKDYTLAPSLIYNITRPVETLVFQNLNPLGFKLQSRQIGLDKLHTLLVLRKLAEYHALSLILMENDSNLFSNILERYPFGLLNMDSCKSASFRALFGGQLLKLIEILKADNDFKGLMKKLEHYYNHFSERVVKAVYPLKGQLNVLNHGDLWVNNLLFYYNTGTEMEAIDVRLIDFQLSFYGSLGFDVNYLLNTSVQLVVLQQHRSELIDAYANTLIKTLEGLAYPKELQPCKKQIQQEIYEREAYGFFVSFAFFPLMSMYANDSHDNSLENLKDEKFAEQKIQLMFTSNKRTIETLKFNIKRLEQLGIL